MDLLAADIALEIYVGKRSLQQDRNTDTDHEHGTAEDVAEDREQTGKKRDAPESEGLFHQLRKSSLVDLHYHNDFLLRFGYQMFGYQNNYPKELYYS